MKTNEFYSQVKMAFTSNPANMLDPYELSDKLALDIAAISQKISNNNLSFLELIDAILDYTNPCVCEATASQETDLNPPTNPSPIPCLKTNSLFSFIALNEEKRPELVKELETELAFQINENPKHLKSLKLNDILKKIFNKEVINHLNNNPDAILNAFDNAFFYPDNQEDINTLKNHPLYKKFKFPITSLASFIFSSLPLPLIERINNYFSYSNSEFKNFTYQQLTAKKLLYVLNITLNSNLNLHLLIKKASSYITTAPYSRYSFNFHITKNSDHIIYQEADYIAEYLNNSPDEDLTDIIKDIADNQALSTYNKELLEWNNKQFETCPETHNNLLREAYSFIDHSIAKFDLLELLKIAYYLERENLYHDTPLDTLFSAYLIALDNHNQDLAKQTLTEHFKKLEKAFQADQTDQTYQSDLPTFLNLPLPPAHYALTKFESFFDEKLYSNEERAEILSDLKEFVNQERPSLNAFIDRLETLLK